MTTPMAAGEAADLELVDEVARQSPLIELGATGLKRAGGYVDEEFLPQLRGRKAIQVYREMSDNDPTVGSLLFTIVQLCRNADFPVIPAGKSRDHANAAKLVETAMDDMSHTWEDLVAEAIYGKMTYGWSWHEVVLKRRVSPWERDGSRRSKYTDGMVGWRRMPVRSHETLHRWVFDEAGGVRGMIQLAAPDYRQRTLPLERSVLFRHGIHKGNPEGRSALRNAYRPWFYKKRLEEFESVGVERDLAGLPMATVPAEYLRAGRGTEQGKMVEAMRKMVRSVRRNEQEGLVFPSSYDSETKQPDFKFELLGSGGARQYNTNELIQRYENRILMTMLADFIMVGHQGSTGTYNMHLDKTNIFRAGINQVVQAFCDDINRHVIPKLFLANGWKPAELPKIKPSDIDAPDLTQLGGFLSQTAGLGFNWGPDADMEKFLRSSAGLPDLGDDDYSRRRKMARQSEATLMAQTQTEYLAARSALAQAQAEMEMAEAGEPTMEEAQMLGQQRQQAIAGQQQQEQAAVQGQQAERDQGLKEQQAAVDSEVKLRTARANELKARQGGPSGNRASGQAARGRRRP